MEYLFDGSLGDDEMVEEADLGNFGEIGKAAVEIKGALLGSRLPNGWLYIISVPRFLDYPLTDFVAAFAGKKPNLFHRTYGAPDAFR